MSNQKTENLIPRLLNNHESLININVETQKSIKHMLTNMDKMIEMHNFTLNGLVKLSKILKATQNSIKFIFFIISILFFKVFLWTAFNKILSTSFSFYSALNEGYKILILTLIFGTLSTIITQISVHFIIKQIEKVLNNK